MSCRHRHQIDNSLRQEGFKKAQSLNEKKFSLEDMRQAFYAGRGTKDRVEVYPNEAKKIIQSLQQPKVFDIEVEMETLYFNNVKYVSKLPKSFKDKLVKTIRQPKITNNSIKILRKL